MIVLPKERPILKNLNTYYLDLRKLFEHYQGEIGSGGVFFKASAAEGVIFFDKDESLAVNYGVYGVPTFYFVDEKGIIREVLHSLPDDYYELFPG